MKKALDINPNHAEANFEYGLSLTTNRDFEEAKKFVMKGLELNPYQQRYYPPILCCVGLLEYEDAINFCNKSIEVDPDFTGAYGWKASMLAHLGRMDEAKEILQPNLNLSIETSETNPRSAFDPILLIDALLYILYRHHEFNSNLEIKTESLPTREHTGNEAGDPDMPKQQMIMKIMTPSGQALRHTTPSFSIKSDRAWPIYQNAFASQGSQIRLRDPEDSQELIAEILLNTH